MANGKIILLNGASSAGKSTLARAIQRAIPMPFWHLSSDQFVESHMLPDRRGEGGEFTWSVLRPRFFAAFHRCLPAIAGANNHLIVDHVIEFEAWMRELVRLLAGFDVFFVGVHCPLDELERREKARGDRRRGEARLHLQVVHTFGPYDLEVDSAAASPAQNAQRIIAAWQARTPPSAFHRLQRAYGLSTSLPPG
jgi:chloramphenicol 3-O phosphotransferase